MEKDPLNRADRDPVKSRTGDSLIDTIIDDSWLITDLLGVGAMSRVYKAKHIPSGKAAVVKLLHNRLKTDQSSISEFHADCSSVMAITMSSFAKIADIQLDASGRVFLIMEFLRGDSLRDSLFKSGPLDVDRAIEIFVQVSAALERLHARKLVHGDLKSSNIFLTDLADGTTRVRLVDSGVVQLLGGNQKSLIDHSNYGSFENALDSKYLSPEQLAGEPAGALDDLYSFGAVMYEALTKPMSSSERVFDASSVLSEDLSDDSDVAEVKVFGLLTILAKCLAKNPADRMQSSPELTEELESLARKNGSSRLKNPGRGGTPGQSNLTPKRFPEQQSKKSENSKQQYQRSAKSGTSGLKR